MGPLMAILVGIPLALFALGSILFWIGWSLHSRHVESGRGAEDILATFSKTLFQNQDTQGFWERFGLATDQATKPGFLPR